MTILMCPFDVVKTAIGPPKLSETIGVLSFHPGVAVALIVVLDGIARHVDDKGFVGKVISDV